MACSATRRGPNSTAFTKRTSSTKVCLRNVWYVYCLYLLVILAHSNGLLESAAIGCNRLWTLDYSCSGECLVSAEGIWRVFEDLWRVFSAKLRYITNKRSNLAVGAAFGSAWVVAGNGANPATPTGQGNTRNRISYVNYIGKPNKQFPIYMRCLGALWCKTTPNWLANEMGWFASLNAKKCKEIRQNLE